METQLLNNTEICSKCGFEYLPEYSFHKEPHLCDKCTEHDIDRVYDERGYPWSDDDDDIYVQTCAKCHNTYDITEGKASVHYCSKCQSVFDKELKEWTSQYGDVD